MEDFNYTCKTLTLALGLFGVAAPRSASHFVSLEPVGRIGISEIRATYGGFFLALGSACLILDSAMLFKMLGIAWLGAAAARLMSLFVDRSYTTKNWGGLIFEGAIGLLCIV